MHDLNDFKIASDNEFAIILATSLEKGKSISEAEKILITTLARARNKNMQYNEDRAELVEVGEPPVRMEPVIARIHFKRKLNRFIKDVILDSYKPD